MFVPVSMKANGINENTDSEARNCVLVLNSLSMTSGINGFFSLKLIIDPICNGN